jgi:UDP-N-acetylglucosamine transferase subunit ALG13
MDRLLVALDDFAAQYPAFNVSAQSGKCKRPLPNTSSRSWFKPTDFEQAVSDCDIFVSHAGMGNILLAAQHGKPIIIMPRRCKYKEHINDHQLATAEGLKDRPFIFVVNTPEELQNAVLTIASSAQLRSDTNYDESRHNEPPQRAQLVNTLRDFLDKN